MPGMETPLDPLTLKVFLTQWTPALWWDVAMAVVLGSYLWAWRRARHNGRGVPTWRLWMFVLGTLAVVVCMNSCLEAYAHGLFWVHMIQHLMLIMLAPALWILGSPLTVWVGAAGGPEGRVARLLRSRGVSVLLFPVTGLALYSAVIVATHLTSFMDKMAQHMWLHHAEAVLYLVTGLVFFWSLLGDEPIRWRLPHPTRMLMLFVGMAPDTVVGIVLMQATHELFPHYAMNIPAWGPSPLRDLYIGGGIMWFFGDMLMMSFLVGIILAWLTHTSGNATAGTWLEGVRQATLSDHVSAATNGRAIHESTDIDDDEAALAAYNEMLRSLHERERAAGSDD